MLRGHDAFSSGGYPVKIDFAPFWKGVYFKRKEFVSHGSKFFPYKVIPFSEGDLCAGK